MARFEDLRVWKEAKGLAVQVYKTFQKSRDFGFKDQVQRAAVSAMNNIAEGFERGSDADFIRFLYIAKSSAGEVRSMIYLARELNYVDNASADELIQKSRLVSGSISNFIKYLKTAENSRSKKASGIPAPKTPKNLNPSNKN